MDRILVIFATTDGQTRKIAHRIAGVFRDAAIETDLVEAGTLEVSPNSYTGVVVCASVHAGGYQRAVMKWVRENVQGLRSKPTAFVSVCLGVLQKDPTVDAELDAIVARFVAATTWHPLIVRKVAGALLYRQYGWIKRWMMKRIVAKAHGDTDTSRDYEYTDWKEVEGLAIEFARLLATPRTLKAAAGF